jgi:solute carrier family 35 protein C2
MGWVTDDYGSSIITRAGVVPLSIAGIFKEVTTITIASWIFGDHLTELNMIGVGVTIMGTVHFIPFSRTS